MVVKVFHDVLAASDGIQRGVLDSRFLPLMSGTARPEQYLLQYYIGLFRIFLDQDQVSTSADNWKACSIREMRDGLGLGDSQLLREPRFVGL